MGTVFLYLLAFAGAFGSLILTWVVLKRMDKTHASFSTLSTDDLKELAAENPLFHSHQVIEELKSRHEDFSFALPLVINLYLDGNFSERLIAWNVLKSHFADTLSGIDFSKRKPSAEDREILIYTLNTTRRD